MVSLSSFELLLVVTGLFVLVSGAVVVYVSSEDTPTGPHLLLVVSLLVGLTTVLGAGALHLEGEQIEYSVDACAGNQTGTPFSELSPEGREVFRSALQADGAYTTRSHPAEFELQSDVSRTNEIQYESQCYELTARERDRFGVLSVLVSAAGGGLAVLLALGSLFGYERARRRDSARADEGGADSESCPNCGLTLVVGVEECQRCGWSRDGGDTRGSEQSNE
ncbi:hypothetical protein GRX03_03950 [Halovenus sp. WSH3]|uniref:DUF7979 domain-containing protein n=1 Tax=Halovenus carboxidivorans TaxID=2692199 RepID=A0A6B0TC30_9EURY|nr:hypothetical protein [Halovenus carboxidivorans]MXR50759.1 hypothetical protein [Halovenus carboxidivorans]